MSSLRQQANQAIEAKQASKISDRFLEKLSSIDLRYAVAIPAVLSTAVILAGVGVEVHHQHDLLKQGYDVLQAYLNNVDTHKMAENTGIYDYIKAGLSDELPSAGAKVQAAGAGIMFYGTPLIAAAATLAKGFANVAQFIKAKVKEVNDNISVSQAKTGNLTDEYSASANPSPSM